MQFNLSQKESLRTLEFSEAEIAQLTYLTKEDLLKKLHQQKNRLSLKYHPDRTKGCPALTEKFLSMTKAYETFINADGMKPSIFDKLTPLSFDMPIDCIDARMEEQLDAYFDGLMSEYLALNSDIEKDDFVKKHEVILQIIRWLHENQSNLSHSRVEKLYKLQTSPSLIDTLYFDFNQLVIQLFAEENLDDISYREAISLGEFYQILALRKLISPIKWFCLVVCILYNVPTTTFSHIQNYLFRSLINDISNIPSSKHHILLAVLKTVMLFGLALLVISPLIFLPWSYVLALFSLPLLVKALFYCANPINQIIRPLSQYLGISNTSAGLMVCSAAILLGGGLFCLASMGSIITAFAALSFILDMLTMLCLASMLKQIWDVSPIAAVALGVWTLGTELILRLLPIEVNPPIETVSEAIFSVLASLSSLGLTVSANVTLYNLKEIVSDLYSTLPLPEEKAPKELKQAITRAAPQQYWSKTLFNTPLKPETSEDEKSSLQKNSLFGNNDDCHSSTLPSSPPLAMSSTCQSG